MNIVPRLILCMFQDNTYFQDIIMVYPVTSDREQRNFRFSGTAHLTGKNGFVCVKIIRPEGPVNTECTYWDKASKKVIWKGLVRVKVCPDIVDGRSNMSFLGKSFLWSTSRYVFHIFSLTLLSVGGTISSSKTSQYRLKLAISSSRYHSARFFSAYPAIQTGYFGSNMARP